MNPHHWEPPVAVLGVSLGLVFVIGLMLMSFRGGYNRGYCEALHGTIGQDNTCIVGGEHVEMGH